MTLEAAIQTLRSLQWLADEGWPVTSTWEHGYDCQKMLAMTTPALAVICAHVEASPDPPRESKRISALLS